MISVFGKKVKRIKLILRIKLIRRRSLAKECDFTFSDTCLACFFLSFWSCSFLPSSQKCMLIYNHSWRLYCVKKLIADTEQTHIWHVWTHRQWKMCIIGGVVGVWIVAHPRFLETRISLMTMLSSQTPAIWLRKQNYWMIETMKASTT